MLNEVRRKPEKPRIVWNGKVFECGIRHKALGHTRKVAYEIWCEHLSKLENQPRPIGHN